MINYIENIEQYENAVKTLSYCTKIGIDTETTGLDPYTSSLLLLQLGDWHEQFIFDIVRLKNLNCDFTELKKLLESQSILKIGHNLVFEYKFIKTYLNCDIIHIFDTMLAEMLITRGLKLQGFGLTDLLEKYNVTNTIDKSIRHNFLTHIPGEDFSEEEIEYAAYDVKYLNQLYESLNKQLITYKLYDVAILENETVCCTGDLELNGIYLNYEDWAKLENLAFEKREKIKEKLLTYLSDDFDTVQLLPEKQKEKVLKKKAKQLDLDLDAKSTIKINFSSPIQVKGFLKVTTGREPKDTEERTLKTFYAAPDGSLPEVVKDILTYREVDKQYSTYGINFYAENVNKVTGRIHASFNQLGADTGRYSSSDPNLQNIPALKEYRACFQAPEGYDLICADLSQFELRVLAELANEESWINVMNNPKGDLHRYVASILYNLPEDQVTPSLRTIGKTLNFSVSYGAGPKKLMESCNIAFSDLNINTKMTMDEAKETLKIYKEKFAGINAVLEKAVSLVRKNHYCVSELDGRIRYINNTDWTNPKEVAHAENIAKNMCAQPVNASVIKKAMQLIRKHIITHKLDAKIVNTIHDELIIQSHKTITDELKLKVRELFIEAGKTYLKSVPVDVDVKVSHCWVK